MADTLTTNYSWVVPTVGTSAYAPKINTDLQSIDTTVKAVSDAVVTAQAAATTAGTNATNALAGKFTPAAGTALTVTGSTPNWAATVDLSLAVPIYTAVVTSAVDSIQILTLTFTNRPATTGRWIWVYVSYVKASGFVTASGLRLKVDAAGSAFIATPTAIVKSGTASSLAADYTITSNGTYFVAMPLYVVGS